METETIIILGVDCNRYGNYLQKALKNIPGVVKVGIRIPEKIALVTFNHEQISKDEIAEKVKATGLELNKREKQYLFEHTSL